MPSGTTPPPVRYGDIILVANFLDPQGRNPKDRPCVVMTNNASPTPEGSQLVVAISTIVPDPPPTGYALLPWQRPHHPKTGLNKPNAAICTWIAEIADSRVLRRLGIVPNRQLSLIADTLSQLARGDL